MTEHEMKELVVRQRTYFETGATLPVNLRITALRKLYSAISANENAIHDALKKDLGKSGFESYMCETGLVLEEISYMLKHIGSLPEKNESILLCPSFIPEVFKSHLLTALYSL